MPADVLGCRSLAGGIEPVNVAACEIRVRDVDARIDDADRDVVGSRETAGIPGKAIGPPGRTRPVRVALSRWYLICRSPWIASRSTPNRLATFPMALRGRVPTQP